MAVFGQGINPALGRIDYTPYAQGAAMGAQGIAQGIAALGQGAAQGVQNYLKRKEEKQQEEAAVSTIGGILKRNPELASQLNLQPDAAGNFDQGALKAAIKGAGGPANTLKLASTLEELGVARQARQQQEQAASYATLLRQGGGQVPSPVSNQALAQFSPQARVAGEAAFLATEQARANLAKTKAEEKRLLEESKPKAPTAPAGYRFTANGNLEVIPGGPAAQKDKPPEGYQWKPGPFAKPVLEAIPGGPAAIKAEETLTKQEAEKQAKEALAADAKLAAATTLGQIQKARPLIDSFLAQGFGSSIGGFFGGTPAQDLEQAYDVIRANEALTRIIALKKASPTGSTGFGALNLKELEVLQSRFAKLSRASSDKSAKEALNDLESVLLKAFPDLKDSIGDTAQAAKPATNPVLPTGWSFR
ncbi:MAG TPA: hypothetical protein VLA31_01330 [Burkholderiaceae bacterium]|nr:hypothetical protein [Burkholderiaceae bacterium]